MKFCWLLLFLGLHIGAVGQTINAAYVKNLHRQYPTLKTDLCPACKLWINPYYRSIADTGRHMPLLTYYIYTKAHRLQQEADSIPRSGVYAAWYPAYGQPSETALYEAANKIVKQKNKPGEIQKGHCQAWILLAYTVDGAILSDTYTFNSAMEFRGQNLGTEIASEEHCRDLTQSETDIVRIWCGTFGSQRTFTKGKLTGTVPSHYYKIINYVDRQHRLVEECYWLPNQPEETRDKLPLRTKTYTELCDLLGFSPKAIFN